MWVKVIISTLLTILILWLLALTTLILSVLVPIFFGLIFLVDLAERMQVGQINHNDAKLTIQEVKASEVEDDFHHKKEDEAWVEAAENAVNSVAHCGPTER
jgi:hypothetical protein